MVQPLPFIQVPLKRTDDADWQTPLLNWIATGYAEPPEAYAEPCAAIVRLRQDIRGAGLDTTGRDILYRYYGQLELLELRFPVDESHVKMTFTWYDSFRGIATSQHSIAYEKACVLYNLGAVVSALGASQPRLSTATSGPRSPNSSERSPSSVAFHNFQSAAGIFMYINDNFLHAPSLDLQKDTVKLLADIMLAQSQECVLERSEGKSDNLRSKLAGWLGYTYTRIEEEMEALLEKGIMDSNWQRLCLVNHFIRSTQIYIS